MSNPGERDEALEKWLRQTKSAERQASGACLDAESAAAWVAGSLSGGTLQQAQTHLADCDRCQALIGSLVRADVAGEPQPAPERTWLRWLVPVTAAATAVIAVGVWTTLPRTPAAPESSIAETPAQNQSAAVQQAPAAAATVDELAAQAPATPAPQSAAGNVALSPPPPAAAKAEETRARSDSFGRFEAEPSRSAQVATTQERPSAPALSDAAAPAPAAARARQVAEPALHDIATPDQSVRWRIGGRQLLRSLDRGATWEAVPVGAGEAFTAGSAPSRTICWLVGRGGLVLLSTNATSFSRVPFPEPTDLIAVAALDARSATITTADGRTFRTSDGGASWK